MGFAHIEGSPIPDDAATNCFGLSHEVSSPFSKGNSTFFSMIPGIFLLEEGFVGEASK